jgi:hypothetical protein
MKLKDLFHGQLATILAKCRRMNPVAGRFLFLRDSPDLQSEAFGVMNRVTANQEGGNMEQNTEAKAAPGRTRASHGPRCVCKRRVPARPTVLNHRLAWAGEQYKTLTSFWRYVPDGGKSFRIVELAEGLEPPTL